MASLPARAALLALKKERRVMRQQLLLPSEQGCNQAAASANLLTFNLNLKPCTVSFWDALVLRLSW
jgi:hypothetical protein